MKHIKRHFQITKWHQDQLKVVGVTIVGELNKLPDGMIEFKFGAARSSIKDNFTKKVGMKLATERFENNPHIERMLLPVWWEHGKLEEMLAMHIAYNPEYIRTHFKTK